MEERYTASWARQMTACMHVEKQYLLVGELCDDKPVSRAVLVVVDKHIRECEWNE